MDDGAGRRIRQWRSASAAVLLALGLTACAGPEMRFYSLAAPVAGPANGIGAAGAAGAAENAPAVVRTPLFIDVAPVGVPERLMRPQLVVRSRDGRIEILEQERWTASFNDELRDTLADGIAAQSGAVDVRRGGRAGTQAVYRIAVDLRRFDGVRGDGVSAAFGWTVTRSDTGAAAACQSAFAVPAGSSDTAGLVVAMQRAVAFAATAISATVSVLSAGGDTACR